MPLNVAGDGARVLVNKDGAVIKSSIVYSIPELLGENCAPTGS